MECLWDVGREFVEFDAGPFMKKHLGRIRTPRSHRPFNTIFMETRPPPTLLESSVIGA